MIVAVIGAGKIGEAVGNSVARAAEVEQVIMTRRNLSALPRTHLAKVTLTSDNRDAARKADVIVVAVKAGDAKNVLAEISQFTSGKIVISLMAAITIQRLERALPMAKVVRSMPNIAALIGEAMTAYSPGDRVTPADAAKVETVLGSFGDYIRVPEPLLNPITALSGSGPAYIAVVIEAMVSAGLKVGIPRDVAFKLVTKTLTGTADLLSEKKMHPAELRDAVTTPAGTTIAGIYELEKGSLRTSIMNAVEAATLAAEKVAKKFEGDD
ncbi:MAG: pyrroline-5-carboxylate reductase [Nitrososphaerota archaeon]|nr:pyrroline-5-carboxylate reductase [Nitrososphaerota archaeon]MDG6966128.1 pyrroline-5-carboxylate reductase [Nitrososphaerota archaeon]MDG6977563.1 pyrroline-5-carboxylate reductase [Nitrososphaerota archaeon]MDG7006138.1 pyrroline-5-carboxylate reductase [Nitrososphaerota archaeon]MDG7020801.1 pyrroline-5-carboxylate reductase [Nitrososphaerota archaeon]